jgi:RNA polymerase sigma-70 factor (ECF subfamily)
MDPQMLPKASPKPQLDDSELARLIASGDNSAFEPLMRRHNRLLYRIARSILRDDAEAQDAVQEAWLRAFRSIRSFRGDSALSTWLARIVVNEAYGRLRRQKRIATVVSFDAHQPDAQPGEYKDMADETTEPPETAAMRTELRQLLEFRINALPEQFRTVFMLRDVQEMSVEETAACLDIPEATVRTRAFRARALLRESLAREIDIATINAFGFDGERCDRIVAGVLDRLRAEAAGGEP